MNFDEPDPEVFADLALRKSSEHDRSRTRTAKYDWSPPAIAGQWRCRNQKCRAWVPVTVDTLEAAAMFNAQLRAKGEPPLDIDAIVVCDACRQLLRDAFTTKRREQVERMRSAIIELKATKNAEREREILDQLRLWHHPDVDGLVQWLRDRDKNGNGRRKRDL